VELAPDRPFRFDFGDGDFFVGTVKKWVRPQLLGLQWKFMGVGLQSDIEYSIRTEGRGSALTVRDWGVPQKDVDSLTEGWADFLSRLEMRMRSGKPTRYLWSQTIGVDALIVAPRPRVLVRLRDDRWWAAAFPDASVSFDGSDAATLEVTFRDSTWGTRATAAVLTFDEGVEDCHVGVVHSGWEELAPASRVDERRRYASLWADALHTLEHEYAQLQSGPASHAANNDNGADYRDRGAGQSA
jgi:hypothetical protein